MAAQQTPPGTKVNKSRVFLYMMLAIPIGLMIVPTMIVLMFALLPSGVAFVMERGKGVYGGVCVGAMNLAGASPYLVDLWFEDHTVEAAFAVLTDVFAILIIYGCAAFWLGHLCDYALCCLDVYDNDSRPAYRCS